MSLSSACYRDAYLTDRSTTKETNGNNAGLVLLRSSDDDEYDSVTPRVTFTAHHYGSLSSVLPRWLGSSVGVPALVLLFPVCETTKSIRSTYRRECTHVCMLVDYLPFSLSLLGIRLLLPAIRLAPSAFQSCLTDDCVRKTFERIVRRAQALPKAKICAQMRRKVTMK